MKVIALLAFFGIIATASASIRICGKFSFKGLKYPDEKDCGKYYLCRFGLLISQQCKKNQLFSTQTASCVPSQQSDCKAHQDSTIDEKPIESAVDEKPIESAIDEKPIESAIDEKPIESAIDEKPIESTIDEKPIEPTIDEKPIESTIVEKPIESTIDEEPIESNINEKNQEYCNIAGDGVLFPNVLQCNQFYECTNGVPVKFDCPAGLIFNNQLKTCDYAERTSCVKFLQLPLHIELMNE